MARSDGANAPVVSCPQCGQPVPWIPESRFRPFCSERCKLIDLGQWANEQHRIPGEAGAEDEPPSEDDAR